MKTNELIDDLRLNHEYCPKEIILAAADEIEKFKELLIWANGKLHDRTFSKMEDALMLDEIKMLLEHGV